MSFTRARETLRAVRGGMPDSTFVAFLTTATLGVLVVARLVVLVVEAVVRGLPSGYVFLTAGIVGHIVALHLLAALLLRARWRGSRGFITVLGVWTLAAAFAVIEPLSAVDAAVAALAIVAVWRPSTRGYVRSGPPLSSSSR